MTGDRTDLPDILTSLSGNNWKPNQLCEKCLPILSIGRDAMTFAHWETTRKIQEAAYNGCHMCSLIHGSFPLVSREACQPSSEVRIDGPWEAEILPNHELTTDEFTITLYVSEKRSQGYQIRLDGSTMRPLDAEQPLDTNYQHMSAFADSTGSAASLENAKSWLGKCMSHHDHVCRVLSTEDPNVLPTRLIEIGDRHVRLRQTSSDDKAVRYLILSYCWGREQKNDLKLTHENEAQLLRQVALTNMPQTIIDAFIVTKRLGYNYIWVDRLCIVQDRKSDWEFEAKRMQAYYMRADCCIAALVPEDAHQGMFNKRNPLLMQPLYIYNKHFGREIRVSARDICRNSGHYPVLYRGPPYALSQRAWVLQERLMAPRTLYFGSLMLYWECLSTRFAEHIPNIDLTLPFSRILRKFGSRGARSEHKGIEGIMSGSSGEEDLWNITNDESGLNRFCDKWADMVEFYTKCQMTFPEKDRLMAITGMMNSITARVGQTFVYGMVASHLSSELLWWQLVRCNGDPSVLPVRIGQATKCPSWSWGSVKGHIQPFWCYRFLQVQRRDPWQLDIKTSLQSLESARSTADTSWTTPATTDAICRIDGWSPLVEVQVGDRIDFAYYCWGSQAIVQRGADVFFSFSLRIWPDEPVLKGQTVWLLNCASMRHGTDKPTHYAGLVIVPVSATRIRFWRRIGYWHSKSGASRVNDPSNEQRILASRTFELLFELGRGSSIYLV